MLRVDAKTNSLTKGLTQNLFKIPFTRDKSIKFDGTDDVITTSADSTLATKTYSFWAKSTDTGGNVIFDHGGAFSGALQFHYGNSHILWMNGGYAYWPKTAETSDGTWHHHLFVANTVYANCKWYLDGVLKPIAAGVAHPASTTSYSTGIRIGRGGNAYFDGSLDEFAIFDGDQSALADTLYNNGRPTNLLQYSTLDHWFRMGEGKLGTKSDGDSNLLFDQGPNGGLGSELVKTDPFVSGSWSGYSANAVTFPSTTTVRVARPTSGGSSMGAAADLNTSILQSTPAAGTTLKISFDLNTDDSDLYAQIYNGSAYTNTTTGSGSKTVFLTMTGTGFIRFGGLDSDKFVELTNLTIREVQNAGTISGAVIKDESTAESVPKQCKNLPSAGSAKSMDFDGTDDVVEVSSLTTLSGASQFTLSGWFKKADTGHRIGISYDNSGSNRTSIFYNTDSNVYLSVAAGSANYGAFSLASTDWVHIVMVFDGTASGNTNRLKGYVDGVEQTLTYNSTIPAAAHSQSAVFRIGKDQGHGLFSQGGIDDVAVWDTALDGDAVKALYNAGLPTPVTTKTGAYDIYRDNLKAYYKMGDASDPAADGTSNLLFDQTSPGLGSEVVTNGDFSSDTDWSKSNSTISDGILTVSVTGGAYSYAHQNVTYTSGRSYRLTAQVTGTAGKQMRFLDNGSNNGGLTTSNGVITMTGALHNVELFWTANSNSSLVAVDRHTNSGDYSFTVDNVSVKEVNGHTGTITGATIQTEAPKQIYALPPVANTKSINFDGTNDHLLTQVDATAQPNNEFRHYCFWAKASQQSSNRIFDHGEFAVGGFAFCHNNNKPLLYMQPQVYQYWENVTQQHDSQWHFWCVSVCYNDILKCELYCDGVKLPRQAGLNNGSMNTYTTGIRIGRGGSGYFSGSLDEFSIHEDLDEEGIRALYNRGRPIDISKSQGAYDLSDNALHWWRMGDATSPAADGTNDIIFQGLEFESDEMFPTNASSSDWAQLSQMAWDGSTLSITDSSGTAISGYELVLPVGATFRLTFDVTNDGTGNIYARIGDGLNTIPLTNVTTGSYGGVHTVTESGYNNRIAFITNGNFAGTITNISVTKIRGQYSGPELMKADSDLYIDSRWYVFSDPVKTYPNGTAARFTNPATGGWNQGGRIFLTSGSTTHALTENMETGCVYKLSFDFQTDDSDAVPSYHDGTSATSLPAGSGSKTFYFAYSGNAATRLEAANVSASKFVEFSKLSLTKVGGAAVMTNMTTSDIQTDTPY